MKKKARRKRSHKKRKQTLDYVLKGTTDMTKLAVTGLVSAGLISTTSAAIKNLTS